MTAFGVSCNARGRLCDAHSKASVLKNFELGIVKQLKHEGMRFNVSDPCLRANRSKNQPDTADLF